jgi:xanthine dehydrogenase accessory factor
MIWKFITSKLKNGNRVVLMVVIESKGSSPGKIGFKMAIAEDNDMLGSIGGGIMEFNLVEIAKKQFASYQGAFLKKQIHNPINSPDSSGMICSGMQTIAFFLIEKTDLLVLESIISADSGELDFNQSGLTFNRKNKSSQKFYTSNLKNDYWVFKEQLGFKNKLYVFGGGHVSVAVSKIFKELDFLVTVFDDRNCDLVTFRDNEFANSKKIIDYSKADNYVPNGDNIYVIIITFGHKTDSIVLRNVINKEVKYIGLMGSKKKIASIFEELQQQGISSDRLRKIDAPIGVQINCKTTSEIAISIAAKIINIKNSSNL